MPRHSLNLSNSMFSSRSPSACSSVEEIVIRPLQFHERSTYSPCLSRCQTSSSSGEFHSRQGSQLDGSSETNFRRTHFNSDSPVVYSDQSIRYVMEQVSLEQARRLKFLSNVKQHRVDQCYFVNGSKMPVKKQAYEQMRHALNLNNDKRSGSTRTRLCSRLRTPAAKLDRQPRVSSLEPDQIHGTSLKRPFSSTCTDENSAVAIPSAFGAEGRAEQLSADNHSNSTIDTHSEVLEPAVNSIVA